MEESKRVKKLMIERTALVDGLLSVLSKKVDQGQTELLKSTINNFVDKLELTDTGKVKNTLYNKRLLANIDTIFDRFGKTQGLEVAKTIALGVQQVVNFSGVYYQTFTTKAKLLEIAPVVKETVGLWLGLSEKGRVEPNGYLDKLIKDNTVRSQVKNMAVRAVIGQQGFRETKNQISEFIGGNKEKAGALERYHRNFVYDLYSQVDRATSEVYAGKLGFNFAIYEGGLIETSRSFCIDRNGKVFHKSEIALFDPPTAKQPGYNPFTDLGGYGCRHHLNWIPDSLAYMLRADAKEKFGNGQIATAAPAPAPAPKKVDPPKPKEAPAPKPKKEQPVTPTASRFDKVTTRSQAKDALLQTVKGRGANGTDPKISMSSALSVDDLKQYFKQVDKLFTEYKVDAPRITELAFKSGAGKYGFVSTYASGGIAKANFGDRVDRRRTVNIEDPVIRLTTQGKSRVDDENLKISTATHEFAHVIVINHSSNGNRDFFIQVRDLKAAYHKEINDLVNSGNNKGAAEIYLGKYAGTNLDEFWAEGFTEYKLKTKPSKYAKLIGQLGDKYFKK